MLYVGGDYVHGDVYRELIGVSEDRPAVLLEGDVMQVHAYEVTMRVFTVMRLRFCIAPWHAQFGVWAEEALTGKGSIALEMEQDCLID